MWGHNIGTIFSCLSSKQITFLPVSARGEFVSMSTPPGKKISLTETPHVNINLPWFLHCSCFAFKAFLPLQKCAGLFKVNCTFLKILRLLRLGPWWFYYPVFLLFWVFPSCYITPAPRPGEGWMGRSFSSRRGQTHSTGRPFFECRGNCVFPPLH